MSTHSKKKKVSIENGMKTTAYTNASALGATGRSGALDSPGMVATDKYIALDSWSKSMGLKNKPKGQAKKKLKKKGRKK